MGDAMGVMVSLRGVVGELEDLASECTIYMNRDTGEFYLIADELAEMVDDDDGAGELLGWAGDEAPMVREVLDSDVWLALPSSFDVHEWAIMDEYGRSLEDPALRDEIGDAIRGRGAFRMFRATVERHGLREGWERFRTQALTSIAEAWLEENGIAYAHDMEAAMEP